VVPPYFRAGLSSSRTRSSARHFIQGNGWGPARTGRSSVMQATPGRPSAACSPAEPSSVCRLRSLKGLTAYSSRSTSFISLYTCIVFNVCSYIPYDTLIPGQSQMSCAWNAINRRSERGSANASMVVEGSLRRKNDDAAAYLHPIRSYAHFAQPAGRIYFVPVLFGIPWVFISFLLKRFVPTTKALHPAQLLALIGWRALLHWKALSAYGM
jgi:hypothetical protein